MVHCGLVYLVRGTRRYGSMLSSTTQCKAVNTAATLFRFDSKNLYLHLRLVPCPSSSAVIPLPAPFCSDLSCSSSVLLHLYDAQFILDASISMSSSPTRYGLMLGSMACHTGPRFMCRFQKNHPWLKSSIRKCPWKQKTHFPCRLYWPYLSTIP